jgi:urease accessory protein
MGADRRLRAAIMAGAVLSVLNVLPAAAHTDQSTSGLGSGLTHPLLGVDHLFAMVTVGILAVTLGRPIAVPATFLAAMTVGGAVGLAGLALQFGEAAIALSVMALGAALIAGRAVHPNFAVSLVALAGFVHGHAHGMEAPAAAHPVMYVAGFVVATATLHLSGVTAGFVVRHRPATRATIGALVFGAGVGLVAGVI